MTFVIIETSHGIIELELNKLKAPITTANFLSYIDDGFYNGTIFHRVISTFMIQGGGFLPGMVQKKIKKTIANESSNGLTNKRGTVAMARTSDPNRASSQFFFNVTDNHFLDKVNSRDGVGYCVFGNLTKGIEVLDFMKMSSTQSVNGHADVPVSDILIIKTKRK